MAKPYKNESSPNNLCPPSSEGDEKTDGLVWITSQWSDEFRIEFDIKMGLDVQNYTSGLINAISLYGDIGSKLAIFGVWAMKGNLFKICYPEVNENPNYCQTYPFKVNQLYHFEISQVKNDKKEATYKIKMDDKTVHEIVNKSPKYIFYCRLWLSYFTEETLANYGELANLKMIDLNPPIANNKCNSRSEELLRPKD